MDGFIFNEGKNVPLKNMLFAAAIYAVLRIFAVLLHTIYGAAADQLILLFGQALLKHYGKKAI